VKRRKLGLTVLEKREEKNNILDYCVGRERE
jgi:hypothetical protein